MKGDARIVAIEIGSRKYIRGGTAGTSAHKAGSESSAEGRDALTGSRPFYRLIESGRPEGVMLITDENRDGADPLRSLQRSLYMPSTASVGYWHN